MRNQRLRLMAGRLCGDALRCGARLRIGSFAETAPTQPQDNAPKHGQLGLVWSQLNDNWDICILLSRELVFVNGFRNFHLYGFI